MARYFCYSLIFDNLNSPVSNSPDTLFYGSPIAKTKVTCASSPFTDGCPGTSNGPACCSTQVYFLRIFDAFVYAEQYHPDGFGIEADLADDELHAKAVGQLAAIPQRVAYDRRFSVCCNDRDEWRVEGSKGTQGASPVVFEQLGFGVVAEGDSDEDPPHLQSDIDRRFADAKGWHKSPHQCYRRRIVVVNQSVAHWRVDERIWGNGERGQSWRKDCLWSDPNRIGSRVSCDSVHFPCPSTIDSHHGLVFL